MAQSMPSAQKGGSQKRAQRALLGAVGAFQAHVSLQQRPRQQQAYE